MSAVIGAAFGGSFTSIMVHYIGSRNLLLASAGVRAACVLRLSGVTVQNGVTIIGGKGAEEGEGFSLEGTRLFYCALSTSAGNHGDYRADLHCRCHRRVPIQCDGQTGVHESAGINGISRHFLRPVVEPDYIRSAVLPYFLCHWPFRCRRSAADHARVNCARIHLDVFSPRSSGPPAPCG